MHAGGLDFVARTHRAEPLVTATGSLFLLKPLPNAGTRLGKPNGEADAQFSQVRILR